MDPVAISYETGLLDTGLKMSKENTTKGVSVSMHHTLDFERQSGIGLWIVKKWTKQ